jgi:proteic killer suppression protein
MVSIVKMIISFKDKITEKIWNGEFTKSLPKNLHEKAQMKLAIIDAANSVDELTIPPSNRLHTLKRNRKGQYSISINMQYRICFNFDNENASEVEINKHYEK